MHPAVEAGLRDHRTTNAGYDTYTGAKLWARIEILFIAEEVEPLVRLIIGRYSLIGVKQAPHKSRRWHYDYDKNEPFYNDWHHS